MFKNEGILAFSNSRCTDAYDNDMRKRGINFFEFFLNGMNYEPGNPFRDKQVDVCYLDLKYVLDNWDAECDIIRRWCVVMGVTEYTIEKPKTEERAIIVQFKEAVKLEEQVWDSDDDEMYLCE